MLVLGTQQSDSVYIYIYISCLLSHFSHVQLLQSPWTVAHQTPLSMGFSRQEYRNGSPCLSPGDLPDPRIKPVSPASLALAGGFFILGPPGKPSRSYTLILKYTYVL